MTDDNTTHTDSRDSEKQNYQTGDVAAKSADERLVALGYKPQFRREMSLFGVLGISFCAIGIHTVCLLF